MKRRSEPGRRLIAGLAAAMMLLAAQSASAQVEPVRTHPLHLKPAALWPLEPPPIVRRTVYEGGGTIVLRTNRTLAQAAVIELRLSEFCRYSLFHQIRDGQFNAVFADRTAAVAYGYGLGLYDPAKAADPSRIYVFLKPASTACEVRSLPNPTPRVVRAAG